MRTHQKPVNDKKEPHDCKMCTKTYSRKDHLVRHMQTQHLPKRYQNSCGFAYWQNNEKEDNVNIQVEKSFLVIIVNIKSKPNAIWKSI